MAGRRRASCPRQSDVDVCSRAFLLPENDGTLERSYTRRHPSMTTLRALLIAAAIASITAYVGPAMSQPAPGQQQADDDDDCDDIMDELKELAEEVTKEQNVPMTRPAG